MNAKCKKCNTYYSVRQTRGTRLKNLRCRKDGGELELISYALDGWKDKDGNFFATDDRPYRSGETVLRQLTNEA